jgi:type IV secretion system protein VirB4
MLYLLDVMDELVDGQRLIYVISEFWKALDNDIFSDFAKKKQKTIRKQNGLGIFDTQSPSDAIEHAIGRTLIEQSVTKIFLANPDAMKQEYIGGFGLNDVEFDIVRSLGARGGYIRHIAKPTMT